MGGLRASSAHDRLVAGRGIGAWGEAPAYAVEHVLPLFAVGSVCPRSETCRLTRNGVAPLVAANSSGGLCFGIMADGFSRRPVHTDVIGSMSARFSVCSMIRRTFEYPSPGSDPRQASTALIVSILHENPRFWIVFMTARVFS